MSRIGNAVRFVRSLSKGIARGDIFPMAGRPLPASAPGGSERSHRAGGPLRRLMSEAMWFDEAVHRLPVAGLAEPLDVLHLTDVHLAEMAPWVERLRDALQPLRAPDVLFITGDLVTRGWTAETVEVFLKALPQARYGRYAILGNWEHWSGATGAEWRQLLARHGVQLLVNEAVDAGPVRVIGTDDHLAGEADVAGLIAGADRPTIVLTHSPAYFPQVAHPDVVLVLSGHSHGGQWRIPGLGVPWVPKGTGDYVAGWYQKGSSWLHVSPGLGWSIAPVRLWCPPEMSRIYLLPGE